MITLIRDRKHRKILIQVDSSLPNGDFYASKIAFEKKLNAVLDDAKLVSFDVHPNKQRIPDEVLLKYSDANVIIWKDTRYKRFAFRFKETIPKGEYIFPERNLIRSLTELSPGYSCGLTLPVSPSTYYPPPEHEVTPAKILSKPGKPKPTPTTTMKSESHLKPQLLIPLDKVYERGDKVQIRSATGSIYEGIISRVYPKDIILLQSDMVSYMHCINPRDVVVLSKNHQI